MIIDWHGHHTTALPAHTAWREAQRSAFGGGPEQPPYPAVSDDELRRRPRYVDVLDLKPADRDKVYEGKARRVYPRLDAALTAPAR